MWIFKVCIFSTLVLLINCADLCIVEDFDRGSYGIFNETCSGYSDFTVESYDDTPLIPRPPGSNGYFLSSPLNTNSSCVTTPLSFNIERGAKWTINYFTYGTASSCLMMIFPITNVAFLEFKNDSLWKSVTITSSSASLVKFEIRCSVLRDAQLAIDSTIIKNSDECFETTVEPEPSTSNFPTEPNSPTDANTPDYTPNPSTPDYSPYPSSPDSSLDPSTPSYPTDPNTTDYTPEPSSPTDANTPDYTSKPSTPDYSTDPSSPDSSLDPSTPSYPTDPNTTDYTPEPSSPDSSIKPSTPEYPSETTTAESTPEQSSPGQSTESSTPDFSSEPSTPDQSPPPDNTICINDDFGSGNSSIFTQQCGGSWSEFIFGFYNDFPFPMPEFSNGMFMSSQSSTFGTCIKSDDVYLESNSTVTFEYYIYLNSTRCKIHLMEGDEILAMANIIMEGSQQWTTLSLEPGRQATATIIITCAGSTGGMLVIDNVTVKSGNAICEVPAI